MTYPYWDFYQRIIEDEKKEPKIQEELAPIKEILLSSLVYDHILEEARGLDEASLTRLKHNFEILKSHDKKEFETLTELVATQSALKQVLFYLLHFGLIRK